MTVLLFGKYQFFSSLFPVRIRVALLIHHIELASNITLGNLTLGWNSLPLLAWSNFQESHNEATLLECHWRGERTEYTQAWTSRKEKRVNSRTTCLTCLYSSLLSFLDLSILFCFFFGSLESSCSFLFFLFSISVSLSSGDCCFSSPILFFSFFSLQHFRVRSLRNPGSLCASSPTRCEMEEEAFDDSCCG